MIDMETLRAVGIYKLHRLAVAPRWYGLKFSSIAAHRFLFQPTLVFAVIGGILTWLLGQNLVTHYTMKLLTTQNSKTIKSVKKGYLTGILYLKPADSGNRGNVCPKSTPGCKASCLNTAGRGQFSTVQQGRQRKTDAYYDDRKAFVEQLVKESEALAKKAEKLGLIPCIRINGTSDLPNLARQVASRVSTVQFYDYTKIAKPWKRELPNYKITFSRSEDNLVDCMAALENGVNVAVVFEKELPKTYLGYPVINGDEDDLRFLDARPAIVGLKAKGRAKVDQTGFVVRGK